MKYNKFILMAFGLMVCAQIYVPGAMVWDSQKTVREGNVYQFKTRPLDPNDPFRGKYVRLRFEAEFFDPSLVTFEANRGDYIFALLETDSAGYAQINSFENNEPECDCDYVKVLVKRFSNSEGQIKFPFDKYYMEESKARPAELAVAQANRRNDKTEVKAQVSVLNGEAIMTEILIDGVTIEEVAVAYRDSISIGN